MNSRLHTSWKKFLKSETCEMCIQGLEQESVKGMQMRLKAAFMSGWHFGVRDCLGRFEDEIKRLNAIKGSGTPGKPGTACGCGNKPGTCHRASRRLGNAVRERHGKDRKTIGG